MVDADRVRDRLRRLDQLIELLEEVRTAGEAAYLRERDTRLKAERALQLALQVCIDVGAHLVGELGLEPPDDYRGVFASLGEAGVVEPELAARLGRAAGLRNLLVHGYARLDDAQVFAALERLDDLRSFAAAALDAAER